MTVQPKCGIHHDTPCTCCACQNESHNATKFRNSLPPMVFFRKSNHSISLQLLLKGIHLIDSNNFTTGLLDFTGLLQKVPETRLCYLGVWCKNAHSIELWHRVIFGGELASNDLILMKARHVCPFWFLWKGEEAIYRGSDQRRSLS